jgi:hypothetical protein
LNLPPFKLDFLKTLTDDTGLIQHTKFATPKRQEGYTTDDNARALIACVKYRQIYGGSEVRKLIDIYLSLLLLMQRSDGRFHNFLSYERRFTDQIGSEDCLGRALWACGQILSSNLPAEKRLAAKEIFDKGLPWAFSSSSLRSKASAILGLCHYLEAYPEDNNIVESIKTLTNQILSNYKLHNSVDWHWFEPYLTYINGRLPQALFVASEKVGDRNYLEAGKESLGFILQVQMIDNQFVPIGNNGWYQRGGQRAMYDQQSVEAFCMTEVALAAYHATGQEEYRENAEIVFEWFLGRNSRKAMVYNAETGGCYDGITPLGLNLNQGAEATVSYLLARLDMESLQQ